MSHIAMHLFSIICTCGGTAWSRTKPSKCLVSLKIPPQRHQVTILSFNASVQDYNSASMTYELSKCRKRTCLFLCSPFGNV